MYRKLFYLLVFLASLSVEAQTLPQAYLMPEFDRHSGYDGQIPNRRRCHDFFTALQDAGLPNPPFREGKYWIGDEILSVIAAIQSNDPNEIQVLHFPPGSYVLTQQVDLSAKGMRINNLVIKGAGSTQTHFEWRGLKRDCFNVTGTWRGGAGDAEGKMGQRFLLAPNWARGMHAGDRAMVLSESIDQYVEGNHTGQMIHVRKVAGDTLFTEAPLRADYLDARIRAVDPPMNIGFECFSINGAQNPSTDPDNQASHFRFEFAVNCWVKGVDSRAPIFQHVVIDRASNIEVSGCYFHEASVYTGSCGGCGYGVNLQNASGECRIVNNIFRRLRHAVLLQFGANGNAVAYNYSFDSAPGGDTQKDDFLFHGAWPFRNIMEGNVVEEIRFDRRRAWNGDHNIVFRNFVTKKGISTANKNDHVAVVGNVTDGCVDFAAFNNKNNVSFDNRQEGRGCREEHGMDGENDPIGDSFIFPDRPEWFPPEQGAWPPVDPEAGFSSIPALWRWTHGTARTWAADCHDCQAFSATANVIPCTNDGGEIRDGVIQLEILGGMPPYETDWLSPPGVVVQGSTYDASFNVETKVVAIVSDADPSTAPISLDISTGPCLAPFSISKPNSMADLGTGFQAKIYPNPLDENSILQFEFPHSGILSISFFNHFGHRLSEVSRDMQMDAGRYTVPIPTWKLSKGLYICHLRFNGEEKWLKVVLR